MDGPSTVAAITGGLGAVTAIATAFIQRGAKDGLAELKKQVELYFGADGKAGPETELGKLKARLAAVEGQIGTAAALAAIPRQVEALQAHVDEQLRAARREWDTFRRGEARRQTGSMPALVDEEARRIAEDARRAIEDAVRRIQTLERTVETNRTEEAGQQRELGRIMGLLESLLADRSR